MLLDTSPEKAAEANAQNIADARGASEMACALPGTPDGGGGAREGDPDSLNGAWPRVDLGCGEVTASTVSRNVWARHRRAAIAARAAQRDPRHLPRLTNPFLGLLQSIRLRRGAK